MASDGTISLSVDVTNTGMVAGKEVVQLYLQDVKCSVDRPQKELKGFKKISLNPGETQTVTFAIAPDDLCFFSEASHRWESEPGKFKAYVCSSETDVRGVAEFELK